MREAGEGDQGLLNFPWEKTAWLQQMQRISPGGKWVHRKGFPAGTLEEEPDEPTQSVAPAVSWELLGKQDSPRNTHRVKLLVTQQDSEQALIS